MGAAGIRHRRQARRESFDRYEAHRVSERKTADFLETELPGWRRRGPILFLYLVAAFLIWSGLGSSAADRFKLAVQVAGAVLGLVIGVCSLALTYRLWWLRGKYRSFIAEHGRFPRHEEVLALKGRLHDWPIRRLRVLATLLFWIGFLSSGTFVVLIDKKGTTPLAHASPFANAIGLIVSGVVLGIGCLVGGEYAERRGRPFGGSLYSLGRRA